MKTEVPDSALDAIMGESKDLFAEGYPQIILCAKRHQLLEPLSHFIKNVYIDATILKDPRLIESILAVALHECDNKYCYYIHAAKLMGLGIKLAEVKVLVDLFYLPPSIAHHEKWEAVLKATYFAFKGSKVMLPDVSAVKQVLTAEEYEEYIQVILLAHFLRNMLYFYKDEIDIKKDKLIKKRKYISLLKDIQDLIAFHEENEKGESSPVLTLCMFCKDIKKQDGPWVPIEGALEFLTPNTLFSHGVCEKCLKKHVK